MLDLILFFLICSFTLASLNSDNVFLFLSIYVLPISGYFIFRFSGNKVDIYKLLLYFSILVSFLLITEFVSENYINYRIFHYEAVSKEYSQPGSVYNSTRDMSNSYVHPLIYLIAPENSFVVRPLGVAVAPQLSGVLLASFIIFSLSIIKHKHYLYIFYRKTIYFSIFSSFIGLLMSSSGTGLLILAIGSLFLYLNKRNFILIFLLAPLFIYLALYSRGYIFDGSGTFLLTYGIFLLGYAYDAILGLNLLTFLIGGDTSLTTDIDYLNYIARFGVLGSLLFLFLLFFLKQCWSRLLRHKRIDTSLIPIVLSILVANFHYDSVFRYPASFIFFMIIGYVSHQYVLMRVDHNRRSINLINSRNE